VTWLCLSSFPFLGLNPYAKTTVADSKVGNYFKLKPGNHWFFLDQPPSFMSFTLFLKFRTKIDLPKTDLSLNTLGLALSDEFHFTDFWEFPTCERKSNCCEPKRIDL
jgi:hypothetical protein